MAISEDNKVLSWGQGPKVYQLSGQKHTMSGPCFETLVETKTGRTDAFSQHITITIVEFCFNTISVGL